MVKSAERAIRILERVAQVSSGLTHSEISRALNIPSGSLTPLLNTLSSLSYLSLDASGRKYIVGPSVLHLSRRYQEGLDIAQLGQPILRSLVEATGESAAIAVESGDHATVVAKENSPRPLRPSLELGERAPLYAGASGKIFLAFRSDEAIERYFSSARLKSFTPNTVTSIRQIWKEIRAIRQGAISCSREAFFEGVTAMSAPVRDLNGKVVAGLVVIGPNVRLDTEKERLVEKALRRASAALSERLGGGADPSRASSASGGGNGREARRAAASTGPGRRLRRDSGGGVSRRPNRKVHISDR